MPRRRKKFNFPISKLLIFLGILILIYSGYGFVRTVYKNYQINKQIKDLEAEISQLDAQNLELKGLISYFKTQSYKEKELRRQLNYQKSGETVVQVIPEKNTQSQELTEFEEEKPQEPNWKIWWDFFFAQK